ncbi:MAG: hypothetical protein M3466_10265 [Gemmatimonadota bacterium]|nr:hypothetical protein [Gemmatimonadota bacterium]
MAIKCRFRWQGIFRRNFSTHFNEIPLPRPPDLCQVIFDHWGQRVTEKERAAKIAERQTHGATSGYATIHLQEWEQG